MSMHMYMHMYMQCIYIHIVDIMHCRMYSSAKMHFKLLLFLLPKNKLKYYKWLKKEIDQVAELSASLNSCGSIVGWKSKKTYCRLGLVLRIYPRPARPIVAITQSDYSRG